MHTVRNYGIVLVLAAASIAWRDYNLNTFLAPGVELVTVVAVVAAILLPRTAAVAITLLTVAAGDVILGSHSVIFLYVWGAWAAIAAGALVMRRARSARGAAAYGAAVGAGSSTVFFLLTNLGTWMIGRGEWVAATWDGLVATYIMGLPFYRVPLAANLVLVPVMAVLAYRLRESAPSTAPAPALAN